MNLLRTYFREEVDNFFSTMDRDFDGRLSFAEMMGEETAVETLFKKMDLNGDGFVTKKVNHAFFFLKFLVWSFLVYISYIVNSAQAICIQCTVLRFLENIAHFCF